jgi:hypothetical protein
MEEDEEKVYPKSDYICPFCNQDNFDLIGLKDHFTSGYCDVFNDLPDVKRLRF